MFKAIKNIMKNTAFDRKIIKHHGNIAGMEIIRKYHRRYDQMCSHKNMINYPYYQAAQLWMMEDELGDFLEWTNKL